MLMQRNVVILDTNVVIEDCNVLSTFKDNEIVIISKILLDEVDNNKKGHSSKAISCRNFARNLYNLLKDAQTHRVKFLTENHEVQVVKNGKSFIVLTGSDFDSKFTDEKNDDRIVVLAKEVKKFFDAVSYDNKTPSTLMEKIISFSRVKLDSELLKIVEHKDSQEYVTTLVTNDNMMSITATTQGVPVKSLNSSIGKLKEVSSTKKYLLDTNVLMLDYKAIEKMYDNGTNDVFICSTVLEELDNHKTRSDLVGYNTRKAIRWMSENQDKFIFVESDTYEGINDDKIIESGRVNNCIVVSNDINVRLKSSAKGIDSEEYKDVSEISLGELRTGKHKIRNHQMLADIHSGKQVLATEKMFENDFVMFYDNDDLKDIMQVKGGKIKPVNLYDKSFNGATPKNVEQKMALTLLNDPNLELVTFSGTFGTSKTFMQLGMALELVNKGRFDKIYIAKAPIPLDKNLATGYKTGDFLDKMTLPLSSITSNLQNLKGHSKFNRMQTGMSVLEQYIQEGIIQVLSLEDILGTSLAPKSILIVEECSTISPKVARAVFSRLGDNSVIFANGDLLQSAENNLLAEDTGLFKLINAFAGYEKAAHLTLETVIRSGFVAELEKSWDNF